MTLTDGQQEMRHFTETSHLPPGDWFVNPFRGAPISTDADDVRWLTRIDEPGTGWEPVGGPPVAAVFGWSYVEKDIHGWFSTLEFWIRFAQEAHPFGRWNVDMISIAYQSRHGGLRAWAPFPVVTDRVTLNVLPAPGSHPLGQRVYPFEVYTPGAMQ